MESVKKGVKHFRRCHYFQTIGMYLGAEKNMDFYNAVEFRFHGHYLIMELILFTNKNASKKLRVTNRAKYESHFCTGNILRIKV